MARDRRLPRRASSRSCAARHVGREFLEHRHHLRAEALVAAQAKHRHLKRLLLVRERGRMVGGERAIPFHAAAGAAGKRHKSEEHTSELQSLMRISYAVFCSKKKKHQYSNGKTTTIHSTILPSR